MRVQYLHMNKYIPLVSGDVTPTSSHLCTISSSVYSGYLLSTQLWDQVLLAMEYGVWPFVM